MPPVSVQRNASGSAPLFADRLEPTTTEPSADTAYAALSNRLPDRSPSPTIPVAGCQRKASS